MTVGADTEHVFYFYLFLLITWMYLYYMLIFDFKKNATTPRDKLTLPKSYRSGGSLTSS